MRKGYQKSRAKFAIVWSQSGGGGGMDRLNNNGLPISWFDRPKSLDLKWGPLEVTSSMIICIVRTAMTVDEEFIPLSSINTV